MLQYSNQQILDFLRKNPVMNIAAIYNNKPISSVVMFAVDDDFTFYFGAKENSYKANALRTNPKISFNIWAHFKMLVQADGVAKEAPNADIDLILDKLAQASIVVEDFWPPIFRTEKDYYSIFEIKPEWMRILDLQSTKIHEVDTPFYEVKLK